MLYTYIFILYERKWAAEVSSDDGISTGDYTAVHGQRITYLPTNHAVLYDFLKIIKIVMLFH